MVEELNTLLKKVLPLGNLKHILGDKYKTYLEINKQLNDHKHCSALQEHWVEDCEFIISESVAGKIKYRILYKNSQDLIMIIFSLLESHIDELSDISESPCHNCGNKKTIAGVICEDGIHRRECNTCYMKDDEEERLISERIYESVCHSCKKAIDKLLEEES